jgi:hypothetical protein
MYLFAIGCFGGLYPRNGHTLYSWRNEDNFLKGEQCMVINNNYQTQINIFISINVNINVKFNWKFIHAFVMDLFGEIIFYSGR